MNAWLTPDESQLSESQVERTILLPGSLWSFVTGALTLLAEAENWEEFGDATPEDTAQFFADVLDDYAMSSFRNVGMISAFCFTSLPFGWLEMNGQTISQSDYPQLADVVPPSWKSGGNITIPHMEDAFLAHFGDIATLGQFSGANTHTLTTAQLPSHNHTYARRTNTSPVAAGAGGLGVLTELNNNTGNAGSGQAHNNVPRNLGVTYAIYAGV